ncbi:metallophosphoesterase family protein [Candidatus Chlamydia sanziniae]|uniref:Calcineurin-like phosphoesterase domain-containing protein n=1 Tax=Candidatus Chlamydia sanziniae TaxID=1806891 RepID=A0A1A9HV27_9CHLA|nr:metallophosphoesterase [Candidatus Chlamydia sanziniae]ANH78695.1 hypothetical protein Cs308_0525 [Candidatus Chlamydia sanziniae]
MLPKPSDAYRLIHISDIHFCVFPRNLLLCFNKRLKGLIRQALRGTNFQATTISERFPEVVKNLDANSVCITGDFSLTAMDAEFLLARHFVDRLTKITAVHVLPGNHDVYTAQAFVDQPFYQYFPNHELQENKIFFQKLTPHWWLILLDCSCRNGWFSANGKVQLSQITALETFFLNLMPEENVIIANHYPLLSSSKSQHNLINHDLLQQMLQKYPQVQLYLHGHEHRAAVYSCKDNSPAYILNSGSISLPSNARFHIIDLYPDNFRIYTMVLTNLLQQDIPLEIALDLDFKTW